ncbi:unnamed protein product [Porites evermanni]|uniref:THAP-type domain-containing protein n=1 Tax=Porites evermanni TaxID=104178 RepID=A0ABN8STK9_9CNID|nr:unnamed protein product [Porites evermanni]
MANDHCSVNCCTNDKRNESGKDLSFFNFPSNKTQGSQWIAAIKRDEGPHFEIKKGCTLVCSAHFKPSDMFKSITGRTRLKAGAVPSQFQWTKACNERSKNKLQNLKEINEMQAQEERRQSIVDSFCQDVELKQVTEQVTVQEASAGAEPMEEMNAELENENIQPAELSAEEQIEILKAKISRKRWKISKDPGLELKIFPRILNCCHFTQALYQKNDSIAFMAGLNHMQKL